MPVNPKGPHSTLETRVAERFKAQGFNVLFEPNSKDLPFDLGTYRPDLVAFKSPNEGLIIEVKTSASRTPIERYKEVAELVSKHPGWRFLMVTGEDVTEFDPEKRPESLPSWKELLNRERKTQSLFKIGESEAGFLLLWGILEAALRLKAINDFIPIERFPTTSLINHLYSQGEISMEQYDSLRQLQEVRNKLVHGYKSSKIESSASKLRDIVKSLLISWSKRKEAD